jgi:hypothetical protein
MRGGREDTHVGTDLGHNHFYASFADPGMVSMRPQERDGSITAWIRAGKSAMSPALVNGAKRLRQ